MNPRLTQAYRGGDANQRPGWFIAFAYDVDVVERLKRAVPHTDRTWSGEAKLWWISEKYESQIDGLFVNFGEYLSQGQLL